MSNTRKLERHRATIALDIVNRVEREWPAIEFEWDSDRALKIIATMIPMSAAEAEAVWQKFKAAIPISPTSKGYGTRLRKALDVPDNMNLGAVLELAIKRLIAIKEPTE